MLPGRQQLPMILQYAVNPFPTPVYLEPLSPFELPRLLLLNRSSGQKE
jgi:hypothetical protein